VRETGIGSEGVITGGALAAGLRGGDGVGAGPLLAAASAIRLAFLFRGEGLRVRHQEFDQVRAAIGGLFAGIGHRPRHPVGLPLSRSPDRVTRSAPARWAGTKLGRHIDDFAAISTGRMVTVNTAKPRPTAAVTSEQAGSITGDPGPWAGEGPC